MVTVMSPILNIWSPSHIYEMTEAIIVKFCTHVGCIELVVIGWQPTL